MCMHCGFVCFSFDCWVLCWVFGCAYIYIIIIIVFVVIIIINFIYYLLLFNSKR